MKLLQIVRIVVLLAATAVAAAVPDPGQKGPYEVGFTNYMIFDSSRDGGADFPQGRPIPVFVWYPVDPDAVTPETPLAEYPLDPLYGYMPVSHSEYWEAQGIDRTYQEPPVSAAKSFPLVLFSPGWGGPPWLHTSIGTRLASHGFVVAVLYHFGDAWWAWEPFHHIAVACLNRPRDVSFALTDLQGKNQTADHLLEGAINPDQVAASGWSLGGYAAMTLLAGDDSVADTFAGDPYWEPIPPEAFVSSLPDPRIRTIVTLDGSNQVLRFQELARVDRPAMGIGQEWTTVGSWQARQHAAFTGNPAYRTDIHNSIHQTFCDICVAGPALVDEGIFPPAVEENWNQRFCSGRIPSGEARRIVGQYTIAFLKTELEHRSGYKDILTPGFALTRERYVEFFVTEKRNPKSIDEDWPDDFVYFIHQPGSAQAKAKKDPKFSLGIERALGN